MIRKFVATLAAVVLAGCSVPMPIADVVPNATRNRQADFSPFYGGAYTKGGCTLGPSINYQGVARTITVRHCADNNLTMKDGTQSAGSVLSVGSKSETVVLSGKGAGRIYSVGYNSGSTRKVIGTAPIKVGLEICASGGNTGNRCGAKIVEWVYYDFGNGPKLGVRAVHPSGAVMVANGNSGAPVWIKSGSDAKIVGIVQGGMGASVPCVPLKDPGQTCYSEVVFSTMDQIFKDFPGATIKKG